MLRKHASVIIAILLIAFVATACLVTTRPPPRGQTVQPVSGPQKHKKHKDGHDEGHGHDDDHDHDHGHDKH